MPVSKYKAMNFFISGMVTPTHLRVWSIEVNQDWLTNIVEHKDSFVFSNIHKMPHRKIVRKIPLEMALVVNLPSAHDSL